MVLLIALHKSEMHVNEYFAMAQQYEDRLHHNGNADVHENHPQHTRLGTRTYFTLRNRDTRKIHEFPQFPDFPIISNCQIKNVIIFFGLDASRAKTAKPVQSRYKSRLYITNLNGKSMVTTSYHRKNS